MARFLLAQSITALCLSFVFPFATIHAATKSLESSPQSGFVISADYEDLRANGLITRSGSQFALKRPADKEEGSLLKFFAEYPGTKSGMATPTALLARMKWGDLTLFKVAARSNGGETTVTIPVRCAQTCIASLPQEQVPGVADPEFILSTFAYFEEERPRLIAGELPRAQSFPVTARVLPERIAPANPYPITFRVNVRPAFAAKDRRAVYDFSSQSWRGKIGPDEAAWQALVRFLTGLRKAAPAGTASYLNKAFANDSAQSFLYTVNEFETRNGALSVTSPLVEPDVFAAKVAAWIMVVPLATVQDGSAVRLFFSTGTQIEDVQQMPINCGGGNCRVVVDDWVNYVHGVIQQPALLRLYRAMFQAISGAR